ncbi:MAG: hypothetical protein ACI4QA_00020 [Candidatus Spyradosoma sp.]
MITTKTLTRTALVLLAGTLAPAAHAAETFVSDGSNIDWFGYRSNTQTVFSYENGTTTMTNLDSDSYVWGYLPVSISLSVGDSLTFSGTALFKSVAATSSFYFGLYDCGENTKPATGTTFSSIVAGTYDMTGFFGGTNQKTTSTTTTDPETNESTTTKEVSLATNVFSRFAGKPETTSGGAGFMTSNQGSSYIASSTIKDSSLAHPVAETAYDFSLKISRTESGYDVSVGDQAAVSFAADKSLSSVTFNVIGMKSPGSGITLTNLSVTTTGTVIPEPSAFGLLAGAFALALAGTRRRARRR